MSTHPRMMYMDSYSNDFKSPNKLSKRNDKKRKKKKTSGQNIVSPVLQSNWVFEFQSSVPGAK